jgi:excisionase family DNA binding protein
MANRRILTVSELAEHLNVHRITIYRLLKNGNLPGFKIGRVWRFDLDEIGQWMSSGKSSEAASTIASDGHLDGKSDGHLDGKLDGKLDDKLDGKLNGKLDGKLDGKSQAAHPQIRTQPAAQEPTSARTAAARKR